MGRQSLTTDLVGAASGVPANERRRLTAHPRAGSRSGNLYARHAAARNVE